MNAAELRAHAAECYAFARSVGGTDLADAVRDLGRAFESAADELETPPDRSRAPAAGAAP